MATDIPYIYGVSKGTHMTPEERIRQKLTVLLIGIENWEEYHNKKVSIYYDAWDDGGAGCTFTRSDVISWLACYNVKFQNINLKNMMLVANYMWNAL